MSDAHEDHLVAVLGGRKTGGSGIHAHTVEEITDFLFLNREIDASGCWLWTGAIHQERQYGYAWVNERKRLIHRVAAHLWLGLPWDAPREQQALHHCDVRLCFRPEHLYVGTHADNFHDVVARGRASHGEQHYRAVLDDSAVRSIRSLVADQGWMQKEAAAAFGISKQTVSRVVRREAWAHV
jgi:predicted XRE-type DNA-binding protein